MVKFYPPGISPDVIKALKLIQEKFKSDPTYLQESLYPADTIRFLTQLFTPDEKIHVDLGAKAPKKGWTPEITEEDMAKAISRAVKRAIEDTINGPRVARMTTSAYQRGLSDGLAGSPIDPKDLLATNPKVVELMAKASKEAVERFSQNLGTNPKVLQLLETEKRKLTDRFNDQLEKDPKVLRMIEAAKLQAVQEQLDNTRLSTEPLDIRAQLEDLYRFLVGAQPDENADPKDQITYARTATNLLTQLTELRGKNQILDDAAQFQKIVLDFISEFLSPEEITELTNRLKDAR